MKILGIIVAVLLLAAGGVSLYFYIKVHSFLSSTSEITDGEIVIEIRKGVSMKRISEILAEDGVVKNSRYFFIYLRYLVRREGMKDIKAGEYEFKSGMTPREVALKLFKGEVVTYRVTIPEGLRYEEIADILADEGFVNKDEFIKLCRDEDFIKQIGLPGDSCEGYLFPDTYTLSHGLSSEQVLRTMVKRFRDAWTGVDYSITGRGYTMQQAVTMASIIEKETGASFERPIIASVFMNRKRLGMKMQADPTVVYGILRTKGKFKGVLTKKDLNTPTPYNTYLIDGLPPGPICNPGGAALKAVAWPAQGKMLYFVSRMDGTHTFCPNYKCHDQAVKRLRTIQRQKKGAAAETE